MEQQKTSISIEKMELINKLVVDLYTSSLSIHNRIVNFFHAFMNVVYFDRASVLFFYRNTDGTYAKKSSISVNWNEKYINEYTSYYCHLDDTLPVLDQPYPIIFRSSSFFNSELRQQTEYWQNYLLPNNSIYEAAANLQIKNSGNLRASYAFYRGNGSSDFTDEELCIIKMFQPHLSNIFKNHETKAHANPELIASLESYNSVGLCILNESFQIIHKTGVFDRLNQLSDNTIMQHVLHLCINLSQQKNSSKNTSMEYKPENDPVFLEVNLMPPNPDYNGQRYCCIAYDLSHFFSSTLEQTRNAYNLTVREFDVLLRVIKGLKNETIAKELFLSVPSVKKNLASIYSKLEITNQKQILSKLNVL